jgi:hypothetical protein
VVVPGRRHAQTAKTGCIHQEQQPVGVNAYKI